MYQKIFKRNEIKFLITNQQKEYILESLKDYLKISEYKKTNIRNLYYDTDNYLLIRRSIERPTYKEKFRIRCYQKPNNNTDIYMEIKKKYNSIVYKRRICIPYSEYQIWNNNTKFINLDNQILNEINYLFELYDGLKPKIFLAYDRESYYYKLDENIRITFDNNIIGRDYDLDLCSNIYGEKVLDDNYYIMEIKCNGGLPLWMLNVLSKQKIYKTRFSKYGELYKKLISKGEKNYGHF